MKNLKEPFLGVAKIDDISDVYTYLLNGPKGAPCNPLAN